MKIIKKILTVFCFFCPLCILKRKFPSSGYSNLMGKVEKFCPFCKAYNERRGKIGGN